MFEIPMTSPALEELSSRAQWVLYNDKKEPLSPVDGRAVSPTPGKGSKRWTDFDSACGEAVHMKKGGPYAGVGYVFAKDDPYVGIDLDKCLNEPWALELIEILNSYTEISPSGKGYHILIKAEKNDTRCRNGKGVEIYNCERYFTFTGNHLDGTPDTINSRQEVLDKIFDSHFKASTNQGGQQSNLNLDDLDLHEKLDAVKLEAMVGNNPMFDKTWNFKRPNHQIRQGDLSAYDISLLNQVVGCGWSNNQMAALIREFRKKHGVEKDIEKFYRTTSGEIGYYPKYQIRAAFSGYSGKLDEKELLVRAEYQEAQNNGQDGTIELLCSKLQINLEKIIQRGKTEESSYSFVIDGKEVLIGSSFDLANSSVVQSRLIDAIRRTIPAKTKKEWAEMVTLFMEIIEDDDEFLLTRERQTKALIASFISSRPPTTRAEALQHNQTFERDGFLWIPALELLKTINTSKVFGNRGISQGELYKRLREIGWISRKHSDRVEADGKPKGKIISKSRWGGKYDETFNETFGEIELK